MEASGLAPTEKEIAVISLAILLALVIIGINFDQQKEHTILTTADDCYSGITSTYPILDRQAIQEYCYALEARKHRMESSSSP